MTWIISQAFAEEAPAADGHGAPAGEAGTAVAHEGGHGGVFPPFDSSTFPSQLLWLAIVFIVLYRLMAKRVIPQISGIIDSRNARIKADIDEAEAARAASEAALHAYEAALAGARARAGAIAAETRARVNREADGRRHAAEAQLHDRLTLAEKHVADVKAAALGHVTSIAVETTEALVDNLIGQIAPGEAAAAVAAVKKS